MNRLPHSLAAAFATALIALGALLGACTSRRPAGSAAAMAECLTDSLRKAMAEYPGEIGVALIIDGRHTVTLNDDCVYPMMSVFKVHQALAVCHRLDRRSISLDTILYIRRDSLDPDTWSPMLKEHPEAVLKMPVRELLRYTLTLSDNNASNLLFERIVPVAETDSFIATLIPRPTFRIAYTEHDMAADHAKAYANCTSPLGAALLMERLFTDSLVSREKQEFVAQTLGQCATGTDRIVAPLTGERGVRIAHKTGSGYTNAQGVLAAHNDVARVSLPGGHSYTLAVFVKDFHGNEEQASQAIARISAIVYAQLKGAAIN